MISFLIQVLGILKHWVNNMHETACCLFLMESIRERRTELFEDLKIPRQRVG